MIIELGHYALILALVLSAIQSIVPLLGALQGREAWMRLGRPVAVSICGLLTASFFALMHAHALSDFSVLNVYQNSHTLTPTLYKLTGVWGNHEGSMLLWAWILSCWGLSVARGGRKKNFPLPFHATILAIQGMISFGFLLFIFLTSNPFLRLDPPAIEGLEMNPILQDPLIAIHPPVLYAGYVGFSVSFCFAIAALIGKKIDQEWAAQVRPWVLAAWIFLTAGITLGATWAYYDLGWGGFWFWDPVENASLMPWLAGTALLHSVAVLEKRGTLKSWTVFLSIFAFSLSLLGTFLVRSGVLTSVHAFAVDPTRGIFILILLGAVTGGALLLFALRAPYIRMGGSFRPLSRETALLLNNVFLFTFAATVFMGTLYPVFLSALNLGSVSVGPPYYVAVLTPLLIPFALLMGAGPSLAWKESQLRPFVKKLLFPFIAASGAAAAVVLFAPRDRLFAGIMLFIATWIIASMLAELVRKTSRLTSWRGLPPSFFGMVIAHCGFALLLIGAVSATSWVTEKTLWMKPRDHVSIAGHQVIFLHVEPGIGDNYNFDQGVFSAVASATPDDFIFLYPERRWYPATGRMISETALHLVGLDMLYLVLGEQDEADTDKWVVRIYYHPLIGLLLLGAGLIALGGLVASADRGRNSA